MRQRQAPCAPNNRLTKERLKVEPYDPVLPLREAAAYLGLEWPYVYRLCKGLRRLAYVQDGAKGKIRLRLSELNRFLKSQEHPSSRVSVA